MADEKKAGRGQVSAREWAAAQQEEARKRQEEITARRLATRARNGNIRPRRPVPSKGKPAAFYLPVDLDLTIIPELDRDYACYFLNLIHWRWCCWKANAAGYSQLLYRLLTRIIPRQALKSIKDILIRNKVIECDVQG